MFRFVVGALAVVFSVATIACFVLGIWLDDDRWGMTGAVGVAPALIALFVIAILGGDE